MHDDINGFVGQDALHELSVSHIPFLGLHLRWNGVAIPIIEIIYDDRYVAPG